MEDAATLAALEGISGTPYDTLTGNGIFFGIRMPTSSRDITTLRPAMVGDVGSTLVEEESRIIEEHGSGEAPNYGDETNPQPFI